LHGLPVKKRFKPSALASSRLMMRGESIVIRVSELSTRDISLATASSCGNPGQLKVETDHPAPLTQRLAYLAAQPWWRRLLAG